VNQLPNAALAVVDRAKIHNYLLNAQNPQNGGKAGLFVRFGFSQNKWEQLAEAIATHPVDNAVTVEVASLHGRKFVVRCNLRTPDGRNPCLTTVWMMDIGSSIPRLVTAY